MPLFPRRPPERRVLSRHSDPRVGYWSPGSVLEIAHYYHTTTSVEDGPSCSMVQLELNFVYRNSYPQTLHFDRRILTNGVGTFAAAPGAGTLVVHGRPRHANPTEVIESPGPGTTRVLPSSQRSSLVTEVALRQLAPNGSATNGDAQVGGDTLRSIYAVPAQAKCVCC